MLTDYKFIVNDIRNFVYYIIRGWTVFIGKGGVYVYRTESGTGRIAETG